MVSNVGLTPRKSPFNWQREKIGLAFPGVADRGTARAKIKQES
jgi:hypothetical protein